MTIAEYLIREFKMYCPYRLGENPEYIIDDDNFGLTCISEDGTKIYYDSLTKSFQNVTTVRERDTEEAWRREFARQLNRKMMRSNIGQIQLSEMTGISTGTISNYLNGKSTPTCFNVSKIEKVLGCNKGELMSLI